MTISSTTNEGRHIPWPFQNPYEQKYQGDMLLHGLRGVSSKQRSGSKKSVAHVRNRDGYTRMSTWLDIKINTPPKWKGIPVRDFA